MSGTIKGELLYEFIILAPLNLKIEIVGQRKSGGVFWFEDQPLPAHLNDTTLPKFQLHKRRWVVERTFAWFGKYRRLTKDFEFHVRNSESMIYIAMINNMSKRYVLKSNENTC